MKKSGLADSPFFTKPASRSPVSEQVVVHESKAFPSQDVFKHTDAQTHERANEHSHKRTDAQMHKRTNEHLNERTDAQTHEHTNAQKDVEVKTIERPLTRESFDIYEDQLETFDDKSYPQALRLQQD